MGVSWVQASEYCNWRTDRVNEKILIDKGILEFDPDQAGDNVFTTDAYLAGQYEGYVKEDLEDLNPNSQGTRKVQPEDGILLPRFRLPTEAEWEYAALALVGNTVDERIVERRIYPWNRQTLPLNEKITGRNQMENKLQIFIELIVFFVPIILVSLLSALFGDVTAYTILTIIGLAFTLAMPIWMKAIYRRMMNHRYANLEGFHSSR